MAYTADRAKKSTASRILFLDGFVDSYTFFSCLLQHVLTIIMFLICYSIDVIVIPLVLVAIPLVLAPTQHAGCESPGLEAKNEQAGSHHFR